jgi:hypothetical protein
MGVPTRRGEYHSEGGQFWGLAVAQRTLGSPTCSSRAAMLRWPRKVYSLRSKLFYPADTPRSTQARRGEASRGARTIIDCGLDAFKARTDNATMVDKYALRSGDCHPKFSSTSASEAAKAKSEHKTK